MEHLTEKPEQTFWPTQYEPLEEWVHMLEDALVRADVNSENQTYMNLPETIGGTSVKWGEKRENKGLKIGGFCSNPHQRQ